MKYFVLFFCLIASPLSHAQAYGFLGFWRNPNQHDTIPYTKTTKENLSQKDAQNAINAFCQQRDIGLSNKTGCFAITPLHNTCAAVAWSRKRGLMSPSNMYIAVERDFKKVAKLAYRACRSSNGWGANCEVETVYCTNSEYYGQ